jgi:hypothetical protein
MTAKSVTRDTKVGDVGVSILYKNIVLEHDMVSTRKLQITEWAYGLKVTVNIIHAVH